MTKKMTNFSMKQSDAFEVSVPLRLDIGGTWDLKSFALPFESIEPCTVNIALDLPTTLKFSGRADDLIHIQDDYSIVTTRREEIDFRSPFGLLLAICSHYQVGGFDLELTYSVPPRSGLGGSGALSAGLIFGINHMRGRASAPHDIAVRVHDIEEGLRFSYCGLQDQCAALYGGVNKWTWHYSGQEKFTREQLLEPSQYHEISDRLLIAYLGRGHGADVNQRQVDSLYDLHTRRHWFEINDLTHNAAVDIKEHDWRGLAYCVAEENDIRCDLIPERMADEADALWLVLDEAEAKFGIAGAGAGGCVFALIDDPVAFSNVAKEWERILADIPKAKLIANPVVAESGVCLI